MNFTKIKGKIPLILFAILMMIGLALCCGFVDTSNYGSNVLEPANQSNEMKIGMANPSSVYCKESGYQYKIIPETQIGICTFPDGSQCDAWDFFEGKCGKKYSYCEKHGYYTETITDGKNSFSQEYAACVLPDMTSKSIVELMNLDEKISRSVFEVGPIKKVDETAEESQVSLPNTFDWRNKDGGDWLTIVKNQGDCGSCWAFSVIGMIEAQYNIATNNPNFDPDLSEEYLVANCSGSAKGGSCCGGRPDYALDSIKNNGTVDESSFPYVDDSCSCSGGTCSVEIAVNSGNVFYPEDVLGSLRKFRDVSLKDKYVEIYYEYSPEIKNILIQEPILLIGLPELIVKYTPAVKYVNGDKNGNDLKINENDVKQLISFIENLKNEVTERKEEIGIERSLKLIDSLDEFEEQLNASVGKNFSQALQSSVYLNSDNAAIGYLHNSSATVCSCKNKINNGCSNATCINPLNSNIRLWKINNWNQFEYSQTNIKKSLQISPLTAGMGIGDAVGGYFDNSGIYKCSNSNTNSINHAVVIVGYNDTGKYWIVKNSWGPSWNGNGYFNVGYGACSIESYILNASVTGTVGTTPIANFVGTPTSGNAPLTVTFTDSSTNTPTSWSWVFGDGDTTNSTKQNPIHKYNNAETYTVSLTATNSAGSNTLTRTGYITVNSSTDEGFLTRPYNDPSINIIQGWVYTWNPDPDAHQGIDYINDTSSTWQSFDVLSAADGVVMYSTSDSYGTFVLIRHNKKDYNGNNYFTLYAHLDSVVSGIPYKDKADVNYASWKSVNQGEFIGRSGNTGESSGIHLHFEVNRGGYIQNRTDPYDIYKNRSYYPGWPEYTGYGPNTLWRSDVVHPSEPVAAFTANPTSGTAPLTVQFTDQSTGNPISWSWSFGDGSSVNATVQHPVHTYDSANTYTVSLNATNAAGSNTKTVANYITVNSPTLPSPTITTILPVSITAGSEAFTLTLNGANYVNGAKVKWDGSNRTTNFVSSIQLTASILKTDIAITGSHSITVVNPDGGTSGAVTFTVTNPSPTIEGSTDVDLLNYLDTLIDPANSEYFNTDWQISKDQYKMMLAALMWGEGGKAGYSAHSCKVPADSLDHSDLYGKFWFSSGIGPLQVDRGGLSTDPWSYWPTIKKLDYKEALKSALTMHKDRNPSINSIDDMRLNCRNIWYAYYKSTEQPTGVALGRWEYTWQESTGTSWDSVKDSNKSSDIGVTWTEMKNALSYNAEYGSGTLKWEKSSEVIQDLGDMIWNISSGDNIYTDKNIQIIINNEKLKTYKITAKSLSGGIEYSMPYYYANYEPQHVEIWAYYDPSDSGHHLKSIFIRDNLTGWFPEGQNGNNAGKTLSHKVVEAATTDVGVYRGGVFYRNGADAIVYGISTDTPVVGDWNGDGISEVGIYRGGVFYRNGADAVVYGISTDTPVVGDWNGDGMSEVGVYRDGVFYRNGADAVVYGISTDTPVVGNWNGDGISDVGVYRGGVFYRNGADAVVYGLSTDIPVIGDWNGDGMSEVGVYRGGVFYRNGADAVVYGISTDIPVIGKWT